MNASNPLNRRTMLKLSMSATAGTVASGIGIAKASTESCSNTPDQVLGPFYPIHQQNDKDVDLTLIKGRTERAKGKVIHIRGRVMDEDCNPIPDTMVEIWQANHYGKYTHERDTSDSPHDPNFQSWAQMVTGADGSYGFKTILPGSYVPRTRHIHFRVARRGYHELVTQCYFPDEPLNEEDGIFKSLTPEQRASATVVPLESSTKDPLFAFNITIRKALSTSIDLDTLDTYLGTYLVSYDKGDVRLSISREGYQLYAEIEHFANLFPKFELRPLGNGRFSYSPISRGQEISFTATKKGKVKGLTIHRNVNPDLIGKKIG